MEHVHEDNANVLACELVGKMAELICIVVVV